MQISKLIPNPNEPKEWLDGFEVMKKLGISKRTLTTYKAKGIIPYSQIEGIYFFKNKDIEDILQKNYIKKK